MGLLSENILDNLLYLGNPRAPAHKKDLVDISRLQAGILQSLKAGGLQPLEQAGHQVLQSGAGNLDIQVLGPGGVGRDKRQVDVGLNSAGELHLGLLGTFLETLQRYGVITDVDPFVFLELIGHPVNEDMVDIITTQVGIAIGGLNLEDTIPQLQDGNVKGPAAKIKNSNFLVLFLIQAVGQGGGGGFIDDAPYVQPGDLAGILGGLTLGVVKVGRGGNNGVGHLGSQIGFRGLLELLENHSADLRGRIFFIAYLHQDLSLRALRNLKGHLPDFLADLFVQPAHEPLDGIDRVLRIGHGLPFRRLADQAVTILGESHHRRGGTSSLGILDDLWGSTLHYSHAGVGRPQIDADYFAHFKPPVECSNQWVQEWCRGQKCDQMAQLSAGVSKYGVFW
ncbi:hypothetical protein ES703_48787 [subsurface metagenome]